ncbi:hypothetical protein BaRGS_00006456, partial [Batillaria attramentaria]
MVEFYGGNINQPDPGPMDSRHFTDLSMQAEQTGHHRVRLAVGTPRGPESARECDEGDCDARAVRCRFAGRPAHCRKGSLQALCQLVISHLPGVRWRRREREKKLPVLSDKMKNYVLFNELFPGDCRRFKVFLLSGVMAILWSK